MQRRDGQGGQAHGARTNRLAALDGRMPFIEYAFASDADPEAAWRVRSVALREQLSAPYEAEIALFSQHGDDPARLLGRSCRLAFVRSGEQSVVHGLVRRVEVTDSTPTTRAIRVTLVPALAALALRTTCRIFQDKTIPEIVDQLLREGLVRHGRSHRLALRRADYPRREYVVQHHESDLVFLRRILHEEGMWLAFEQPADGDAECVLIADDNAAAERARLGEAGDTPELALDSRITLGWEAITHFGVAHTLTSEGVRVRAYDWTHPTLAQAHAAPKPSDDVAGDPWQSESTGVTSWGYERAGYTRFDADEQARVRWEHVQGERERALGHSNLVGLRAGLRLRIADHPDGLDGEWLVTSVEGQSRSQGTEERAPDYANTFTCIRMEQPFRPPRLEKPRVHGIQSAIVVGADGRPEVAADGDDIHTDEYGRVRVKLSWDATVPATPEATITCWLRVAQLWAGSRWGALFIPRVGMEVIVSFVDGDPDRPLVTGCVHNGLNRPLLENVARDKTRSYLKSRSTPRGEGGNELRFDDARGREELYVHAQKDHVEVVEDTQRRTVKGAQHVEVKREQTLTVRGARTKDVGGDDEQGETSTIRGVRKVEVTRLSDETIGAQQLLRVKGDAEATFHGRRATTVTGLDQCTVTDGDHTVHVAKGSHLLTAKRKVSLCQDDAHGLRLEGCAELFTKGVLTLRNEKVRFEAGADGTLRMSAETGIELVCGAAKLSLAKDGSVTIDGKAIKLAAPANSIALSASAVTTEALTITANASVVHEVKGTLIKIG